MPTFDIPAFRKAFPEFDNTEVYPTTMIELWAGLASRQVRSSVWGPQWTIGVSLYVAHEITLARQNVQASKVGGVPGTSGGIANTKTVGSVTVGYDTQSTAEKNAGYWNLTNYGKQFFHLSRIFGMQAIQL